MTAKKSKALRPRIEKGVFVDPSAVVSGAVTIGAKSSIWPGCVLRGDINRIRIGACSNIQDLSVVHVESDRGCRVGDYVTVGHRVILHACTVRDQVLVGMGSVVLDGAIIGEGTILGAGSLVTQKQRLKAGSLYFGRPARFVRSLTRKEIQGLKAWARRYVAYARRHLAGEFERL